jgi:threonine/homoserine/homoserine lactone efflux protein
MILEAVLKGVGAGLWLSLMAGPIFFMILQSGIQDGPKPAIVLAAGQWISDLVYLFIAFYSADYMYGILEGNSPLQKWIPIIGLIGCTLLITMGLEFWIRTPKLEFREIETKQENHRRSRLYLKNVLQGFLINTFSPSPIAFWMGLVAWGVAEHYSDIAITIMLSTVLIMVVVTDLVKIYMAKKIRNYLKKEHLIRIRRLAGSVLILFGTIILYKVYWSI